VTQLARVAGRPGDELAVLDDAAADAGAHECGDDVAIAPTHSQAILAVAADADVVLHQHRALQRVGEVRAEREVADIHVRAEEDDARLGVERPGRADARRGDLIARHPRHRHRIVNAPQHREEDRLLPLLGRGRALASPQDDILRVDHTRQNLGSPQVDPDHGRTAPLTCHAVTLPG
jgi:hypothetical protein